MTTVEYAEISHLESVAANRAPGYIAACYTAGVNDGRGRIWFTAEAHAALRAAWPPLKWAVQSGKPLGDGPDAGPIPRAVWPRYIAVLASQAQPGEAGAGDTVERLVGPFGGEAWRRWYAKEAGIFAAQCRCSAWKARWNALYPYSPQ